MTNDREIVIGVPPVGVTLRRSDRARRFSLRVSRSDGRVTLSLPRWAPEAEALRFAQAQEGWIRRALAALPQGRVVVAGGTVLLEGREVPVLAAPVRAVRLTEAGLLVPTGGAAAGLRVAAYLKLMARQRLLAASEHYAALLGRRVTRLTLRDTRSRWGSCAADGSLMYSWRLIMAPPDVLDYVAAHEVAHFEQMNHSPAFWAVVARLMPDHARHRAWLRSHGQGLHAIRFDGVA